jgi:hypothetical protein
MEKMLRLGEGVRLISTLSGDTEHVALQTVEELAAILALPALEELFSELETDDVSAALGYLSAGPGEKGTLAESDFEVWGTLFAWACSRRLGSLQAEETISDAESARLSRALIDEWLLGKLIARTQQALGLDEGAAWRSVDVVRLLSEHSTWYLDEGGQALSADRALKGVLQDSLAQRYIGVNRFEGVLWFNRESFQELAWWLFAACAVQISTIFWDENSGSEQMEDALADFLDAYAIIQEWLAALEISAYQLDKLVKALETQSA